jgi:hypothetical protein
MDPRKTKILADKASQCRDAYIFERTNWHGGEKTYKPGPKWDGGEDRNGHIHKAVWPKIAEFVMTNRLDPYKMTAIRFGIARGSQRAPFPNQIARKAYLDAYFEGHEPVTDEQVEVDMKAEMSHCAVQLTLALEDYAGKKSKENIWRLVLFDKLLDFSPLMLYCMGVCENLEDVAEANEIGAINQYAQAPKVYDRVWGNKIPAKLKEDVEHIYGSALIGDHPNG